jgi:hypothetical protein
VEPTVLFIATPATSSLLSDHPDLIPTSQVSKMAPPINPFKLMGKTAGGSPSETKKSKGKGRAKDTGAGKKLKKPIAETSEPELPTQNVANQEPLKPLPVVHELDDYNHGEEAVFKRKRARVESFSVPAEGESSNFEAWVPDLVFGLGPISVRDTVLDNFEIEISTKVAHGLSRVTCLPEDMKLWDTMDSRQIFRHISRGMMMVIVFSIFLLSYIFVSPYLITFCFFLPFSYVYFWYLGCSGCPLHGS